MINRFWSGLCMLLLLSGCGWDGTATRPNDFSQLTSITISAVYPIIANGTSTKLAAIGHYSGGFSRDITDTVVWSSASPTVADFKYTTAPNRNRVTGNAPGSAVVTATVDGVSSTYTVTVSNATVTAMTISPVTPDPLPKGKSLQFSVKGDFSDVSTQDLTFDAAWSSDTVAVATVSNDSASKGLAKAEAAVGSATISATFPPAGGSGSLSGTKLLTVTNPSLDSITVTPTNPVKIGIATVQFTATGNYSDGSAPTTPLTVTWTSSLTDVATIDPSSGLATTATKGGGTTIISATTAAGIKGTTTLTQSLTSLVITPTTPNSMIAGSTQQLTATATFNNGSTENVSAGCTWTSSTTSVATVDTKGLVTAAAGASSGTTTTITATYNGLPATPVSITVR